MIRRVKNFLVWLWRRLPDLWLTIIVAVILAALFSAATLTPMSGAEAESVQEFISSYLAQDLAIRIFLNNFVVALIGEIPFLGPPILGYVVYNSGRFVGWQLAEFGFNLQIAPPLVFATTFLSGYGLLEFMGYALSATKSIQVSRRLAKALLRKERVDGGRVVEECGATLLAAAIFLALGACIETYFIESLTLPKP